MAQPNEERDESVKNWSSARWSDCLDLLETMVYKFDSAGEIVTCVFVISTLLSGVVMGEYVGGDLGMTVGGVVAFSLVYIPLIYVMIRHVRSQRDHGPKAEIDSQEKE
ncbi:MAG: hypothetical protein AAGJ38_10760 [Planctomycetota bacterium]